MFFCLKLKRTSRLKTLRIPATSLLPIGSVVDIKGEDGHHLIVGIRNNPKGWFGREYDYMSVPYPEGFGGARKKCCFDHTDITKVLARGYNCAEHVAFVEAIDKKEASRP